MMNEKQKKVLKFVAAAVVLMLVFPPFQSTGYNGRIVNDGYDLIFDPPSGSVVNISMLLVQWICVFIVGGVFFFVFKDDVGNKNNSDKQPLNGEPKPPTVKPKKELKGVGGWLAFLIFTMTVVNPLGSFVLAANGAPWVLLFTLLGFAGGLDLWFGKNHSSVTAAKWILWICGPFQMFLLMAEFDMTGAELIASIVITFAWTKYLSKSERVKNTYPEDEKSDDHTNNHKQDMEEIDEYKRLV